MNFEHLISMKNLCENMARQAIDDRLKKFYANAAKGFEMKILKLKIN